MPDWVHIVKAILELGALGVLLIFSVRMWYLWTEKYRESMDARVQAEKDHSKEIMRLQASQDKEMAELVRQYDMTLTQVSITLDRLTKE